MATPQFDGGRWKLRLENAPLGIGKPNWASTPFESTLASTETRSRWIPVKNEYEATR
jgi:hypothetical protein